jgi:hypothetical protein
VVASVITTLLATFGILSAVVNTIGMVPYVKDTLKHKTKPERATWWVWLAIDIIAFAAQVGAGSTWSLLMTGAGIVSIGLIAFLSLSYGYGRLQYRDIISLVGAAGGIILWKLTKDPLFALVIIIIVDLLAVWLTVAKTWKAQHTETLISWVLSGFSAILGLLAVGKLNFTQLLYPVYASAVCGLMVWIIIYRRKGLLV